jgi:hypothetical protein
MSKKLGSHEGPNQRQHPIGFQSGKAMKETENSKEKMTLSV